MKKYLSPSSNTIMLLLIIDSMWKWETVVNIYYVKVIMQEKLKTSSLSKEKNTVAS